MVSEGVDAGRIHIQQSVKPAVRCAVLKGRIAWSREDVFRGWLNAAELAAWYSVLYACT